MKFNQRPKTCKDSIRWLDIPSEARVRQLIQAQLDLILPSVYGYCLVSIGSLADDFTFEKAPVVNVHRFNADFRNDAWIDCTQLPLASDDVDAIFLPFQLEQCGKPHSLLREAYRALRPGGKLILVAFNPVSSWGVHKLFKRFDHNKLWQLPFYRTGRLMDWLDLLDFKITVSHNLYNPWSIGSKIKQKDYSSSSQYSALGALTVMVAEKRISPLTPSKPWKKLKTIHPAGIESLQRNSQQKSGS